MGLLIFNSKVLSLLAPKWHPDYKQEGTLFAGTEAPQRIFNSEPDGLEKQFDGGMVQKRCGNWRIRPALLG